MATNPATTATAPDRLSELPDDLLIRILSFAPAREAASTTALSRRWRRPLWLDTGAVNLDYRSYATGVGGGDTVLCLRPGFGRAYWAPTPWTPPLLPACLTPWPTDFLFQLWAKRLPRIWTLPVLGPIPR